MLVSTSATVHIRKVESRVDIYCHRAYKDEDCFYHLSDRFGCLTMGVKLNKASLMDAP
jgi:hypothetical protein